MALEVSQLQLYTWSFFLIPLGSGFDVNSSQASDSLFETHSGSQITRDRKHLFPFSIFAQQGAPEITGRRPPPKLLMQPSLLNLQFRVSAHTGSSLRGVSPVWVAGGKSLKGRWLGNCPGGYTGSLLGDREEVPGWLLMVSSHCWSGNGLTGHSLSSLVWAKPPKEEMEMEGTAPMLKELDRGDDAREQKREEQAASINALFKDFL